MFLLVYSVKYDYHKEIIMSQEIVRETVVIDSHHVKGYAFNIDIKAVSENQEAINHMELAMEALYSRTHRLQAAKK
jgi:hypothetical protein